MLIAAPASAFTTEQVDAGRRAFELTCATCHGTTLREMPNAILAGPEFVERWGDRTTDELIRQVRAQMPPESPGGLPRDAYADIIAFVLQMNGAAPNGEPLTTTSVTQIGEAVSASAAAAADPAAPGDAAPTTSAPAATPDSSPAEAAVTPPTAAPDLRSALPRDTRRRRAARRDH